MPAKLKIAITGGIGAGKSEVSRVISGAGYLVIDADKVAKEILSSDHEVKRIIIKEFGAASYSNGFPDKTYLAKNVFSDPQKVEKINAIIHPRTILKIMSKVDENLKTKAMVFVESALIFEANRDELFDYIIHVSSIAENRLDRAAKSKGISKSEVEKRMLHQLDEETKKRKSDFIIENNSTLEDLENKTMFVLKILESISKG